MLDLHLGQVHREPRSKEESKKVPAGSEDGVLSRGDRCNVPSHSTPFATPPPSHVFYSPSMLCGTNSQSLPFLILCDAYNTSAI